MAIKDVAALSRDFFSAEGPSIVMRSIIDSRQSKLRPSPNTSRLRGMTLMELMIGLAITAIVAAVIAVLMNSTAVGTNSQQDGRRSLVKFQAMKAKVGDELANARCILDATPTNGSSPYYIIYWTGDQAGAVTPVNGAVNLSELRMLEVDSSTGNLNLYTTVWPAGTANSTILSNDQTYAAGTTWRSAAVTAKGGAYFTPTLIATGVTSMTASLDSGTMTKAKMASIQIAFTDSAGTKHVVATAQLANQKAPQ
jgi:prepilin-type N-terminal cleavage/methylation domain-containing protein